MDTAIRRGCSPAALGVDYLYRSPSGARRPKSTPNAVGRGRVEGDVSLLDLSPLYLPPPGRRRAAARRGIGPIAHVPAAFSAQASVSRARALRTAETG